MLVLVVMSPLPAWEIMKPILDAVLTRCAVWERRNSLGLGFKDKQLMIGRFSNFTSSYTVVLLSIICTQLGFRADQLGYLRVPTHALGSVEFDGMSSAGLTSTACWRGTYLSSACSEVSLPFVSLAQNGPLSWPPKGNIFTGILGHSRTFLHIVFYRTHDWLASIFYCRRS